MSLTCSLVRPRRLGPPLLFDDHSAVLCRGRGRGRRLVAVGAVRAGTTAASAAAAAPTAGQPVDGRAHLEGGAELHAEPAGEVLLGQQGERAAVDALLSKGLKREETFSLSVDLEILMLGPVTFVFVN